MALPVTDENAYYVQIEDAAAELRELRVQLAAKEAHFKQLIAALPSRSEKLVQTPRPFVVSTIVAGKPASKPTAAARPAPKNTTNGLKRTNPETLALLRYMRTTAKPDTGTMAKILVGRDDRKARSTLHTRKYELKKKGWIEPRAGGGFDVLIEVPAKEGGG